MMTQAQKYYGHSANGEMIILSMESFGGDILDIELFDEDDIEMGLLLDSE